MAEHPRSKAKPFLWLFLLVVLFVLGAYGFGRWQGAQAVEAVREEAAAARQAAATSAAQAADRAARAQAEVVELRSRVQMLRARRQLHLALLALDQRNFGIARNHLLVAGGELAAVQQPPAGSDAAVLSLLAQELRSARLVATEDFSQQRQRVLAWARKLDTQFPAEPPPPAPGGPAAGAETPGASAPGTAAPGSTSTPASPGAPEAAPPR